MNQAVAANLSSLRECSHCHTFTREGFFLQSDRMSRFVCRSCYDALSGEYPAAPTVIQLDRQLLTQLTQGNRLPFQAGYLLGSREDGGDGHRLIVRRLLASRQIGAVVFFHAEDVPLLRGALREGDDQLLGLYRTSPDGCAAFNDLDQRTFTDLLSPIVYMVIGGADAVQISARDKAHPDETPGIALL